MPERGGVQGQYLTPYQVSIASGQVQMRTRGAATASGWFGALDPPPQNIPSDVRGRALDFMPGANLQGQPKAGEGITFAALRAVADAHDLLRLVIETRKDQVGGRRWAIKPREGKGKPNDPRVAALTRFFRKPDGVTRWSDWLRSLVEDVLVIDAPALFRQRDRAGRLLALEQIDGATVMRIIGDDGRTPMPTTVRGVTTYPVAYQQILKGGRLDYTARDLIYAPRNRRISRLYGFSPVEQVLTTVNIALRRQQTTLEYFTAGSIPDSLIGVPEGWTPAQIKEFQSYWDSLFTPDNTALRRRAKFIPNGLRVTTTREPVLKNELDEWLARVICFAFSVSPQALSKMMNRATADVAKAASEDEGLNPLLDWIKGLIDEVLEDEFGCEDLEFAWQMDKSVDEKVEAEIVKSLVAGAIITPNQGRARLGLDPDPDPAADKLLVLTGTGFMLLNANTIEGKQAMAAAFPPSAPQAQSGPPQGGGPDGGAQPGDGGAGPAPAPRQPGANGRQRRSATVAKAAGDDAGDEPEPFGTEQQEGDLLDALVAALAAQGEDAAAQLGAALAPVQEHHTAEHIAEAVAAALLLLSWSKVQSLALVMTMELALKGAAARGVAVGLADAVAAGAPSPAPDAAAEVSLSAEDAARRRAAEMVGMRWVPAGPDGAAGDKTRLEADPSAQASIVDTMKMRVRKAVDGVAAGDGFAARVAEAVRALPIWGEAHAEGIAASEVEAAANGGAMAAYEATAPELGKRWAVLAEACPKCVANAAEGVVPLGHAFRSGHGAPPAHPRCRCRIVCEALPVAKAYNPKQLRDAGGRWESFDAFVSDALALSPGQHLVHEIGTVENGEDILSCIGVDISGWSRRADNYGLRHILDSHGDPKVEALQGQEAITPSDLGKIKEVVTNPDSLEDGGKNDRGQSVVRSQKAIGDHLYIVAEEIRGKKHRTLMVQSMWKRRVK